MDRQEHIKWCKKRALEYLEPGKYFSFEDAFLSMISDIAKHEETQKHCGINLGMMLQINGYLKTEKQIREWIVGFN